MYLPLNGPATTPTSISVSTTAVEIKAGITALVDRTAVTFQPIDGDIYYGYGSAVTTSTGFLVRRESIVYLEAGDSLPIWAIAASGSVDVRVAEVQ